MPPQSRLNNDHSTSNPPAGKAKRSSRARSQRSERALLVNDLSGDFFDADDFVPFGRAGPVYDSTGSLRSAGAPSTRGRPSTGDPAPRSRHRSRHQPIENVKYNRLLASYRFLLRRCQSTAPAAGWFQDFDTPPDWDLVDELVLHMPAAPSALAEHLVEDRHDGRELLQTCVICLSTPFAARITPCGHIFCYTCLLRMLLIQNGYFAGDDFRSPVADAAWAAKRVSCFCPVCSQVFSLGDIRPVRQAPDVFPPPAVPGTLADGADLPTAQTYWAGLLPSSGLATPASGLASSGHTEDLSPSGLPSEHAATPDGQAPAEAMAGPADDDAAPGGVDTSAHGAAPLAPCTESPEPALDSPSSAPETDASATMAHAPAPKPGTSSRETSPKRPAHLPAFPLVEFTLMTRHRDNRQALPVSLATYERQQDRLPYANTYLHRDAPTDRNYRIRSFGQARLFAQMQITSPEMRLARLARDLDDLSALLAESAGTPDEFINTQLADLALKQMLELEAGDLDYLLMDILGCHDSLAALPDTVRLTNAAMAHVREALHDAEALEYPAPNLGPGFSRSTVATLGGLLLEHAHRHPAEIPEGGEPAPPASGQPRRQGAANAVTSASAAAIAAGAGSSSDGETLYFYQSSCGRPIFMHGLFFAALTSVVGGDPAQLPPRLLVPVSHVDHQSQTYDSRNRLKNLAHLPYGASFYTCGLYLPRFLFIQFPALRPFQGSLSTFLQKNRHSLIPSMQQAQKLSLRKRLALGGDGGADGPPPTHSRDAPLISLEEAMPGYSEVLESIQLASSLSLDKDFPDTLHEHLGRQSPSAGGRGRSAPVAAPLVASQGSYALLARGPGARMSQWESLSSRDQPGAGSSSGSRGAAATAAPPSGPRPAAGVWKARARASDPAAGVDPAPGGPPRPHGDSVSEDPGDVGTGGPSSGRTAAPAARIGRQKSRQTDLTHLFF